MNVKLILFREDGSRRDFQLPPGASTIGRKDDCTIRVPLASVSRRHAEIIVEKGGIVLRDLGAANGTFLNSRRVTEEKVKSGDQILIGPVVFTVQINGKPSDDEIIKVRSKAPAGQPQSKGAARVGTSKHVRMSDEEVDPISALEALASSADQTAIEPEKEED
ncbi:MAG: FHA domain-containing protein [Planctomycetota bacterium]